MVHSQAHTPGPPEPLLTNWQVTCHILEQFIRGVHKLTFCPWKKEQCDVAHRTLILRAEKPHFGS